MALPHVHGNNCKILYGIIEVEQNLEVLHDIWPNQATAAKALAAWIAANPSQTFKIVEFIRKEGN